MRNLSFQKSVCINNIDIGEQIMHIFIVYYHLSIYYVSWLIRYVSKENILRKEYIQILFTQYLQDCIININVA